MEEEGNEKVESSKKSKFKPRTGNGDEANDDKNKQVHDLREFDEEDNNEEDEVFRDSENDDNGSDVIKSLEDDHVILSGKSG